MLYWVYICRCLWICMNTISTTNIRFKQCYLSVCFSLSAVATSLLYYCGVPNKRPWALKHYSQFSPSWTLTQDINYCILVCLYRNCYIDPLKCGTWALTRDTMVADYTDNDAAVCMFNICSHVNLW